MPKKLQVYLFILTFAIQVNIKAQNYIDLSQLSYSNTPLNQFDSTLNKTRVQDLYFSFSLPYKINEKTALIFGLDFEGMYAALTPQGNGGSVAGIMLKLGFNKQLNSKWNLTAVALPRIASDFKGESGLTAEDFQLGGLAMFKYAKTKQLKYKIGLYYNSELFGPFFSIILGLYYKSENQKLEADISLPSIVDVNYRLKQNLFVGLKFNAFVRTFNLHDPYYHINGEYLAKTSNEIHSYLGFEPKKGLILRANIGYSVGRNYRLYDIQDKVVFGLSVFRFGDDRKQLNSDFADGVILKLELLYRFYTDKKGKK
jgi:hypothetical protein